ncbi:MAG: signal recognition particle-docking protein FtsY [Gammaproteobacteria bacterium]|nr:signal recognition particle-docking protein FtsY [Gammaproteobacteria bacterium]
MVFGFGRKKPAADKDRPAAPAAEAGTAPETAAGKPAAGGLFARLRAGLSKTRNVLNTDVRDLISLRRQIDDELLEELETQLLVADVGVEATQDIIQDLTRRVARKQLTDADALLSALREDMAAILEPVNVPLQIPQGDTPYVILMVGVNGVGKTTTIGKLARRLQDQGRSVMLAAGDTFRAAAVEQLQVWGERNEIPVIAQQHGADSAAVIFDALQSARARGADVLIADTAGRLHTQSNLMEELKKIKRVLAKLDPEAPHEVMLVVDAGTGQNALNQAQQFHEAVGVTGLTLTKLDGTAKGGIIFAIARRLGVPIRFIGVGEKIEDLRPFEAGEFVAALFGDGADDSEAA